MSPEFPVDDLGIESFRALFNPHLEAYLRAKVSSQHIGDDMPLIVQSLEQAALLVNGGGKRIRPYLAFLAYITEGGTNSEVLLPMAMALELFHAFALMHDDVVDRGAERHGIATIHTAIAKTIASSYRGDALHLGEGMAVLTGDLLFGWSHELIASIHHPRVQELFFAMIEQVVIGQMLDVSFMTQDTVTAAAITKKNELKTARYSFVSPMVIGATLAGNEERIPFYTSLGLSLGKAFQIQDDLLDIMGGKSTGKKRFIDIEDHQHTAITQYVFDHGTKEDATRLAALFGKPLSDNDREELLQLFTTTGAIAFAEGEIAKLMTEARTIITASSMGEKEKDAWHGLVDALDKRKK